MSRGRLALISALLASASAACDAAAWYRCAGTPSFEELEPGEARAWLEGPGAALVQVQRPGDEGQRLRNALVISPDALPELPPGAARVVVVAQERAEGLRLAARLARARDARVGLVAGGTAAWGEEPRRAALPRAAAGGPAGG